MYSQGN